MRTQQYNLPCCRMLHAQSKICTHLGFLLQSLLNPIFLAWSNLDYQLNWLTRFFLSRSKNRSKLKSSVPEPQQFHNQIVEVRMRRSPWVGVPTFCVKKRTQIFGTTPPLPKTVGLSFLTSTVMVVGAERPSENRIERKIFFDVSLVAGTLGFIYTRGKATSLLLGS